MDSREWVMEILSKHMSAHKRAKVCERLSGDAFISPASIEGPNGGRPATVIRVNGLTDRRAPAANW